MLNFLQSDFTNTAKFSIGIANNFNINGDDNSALSNSKKIEQTPPILDYEKQKFDLIDKTISQIRYQLYNENGSVMYFSDLGFDDDDIFFIRNGYKESYLQLNFYDSDKIGAQNQLFSQKFRIQRNSTGLNGDGEVMPANQTPVVFILRKPPQVQYISENFFIYWYNLLNSNMNMYAEANFFNAKNGKIYPLISYNSPVTVSNLKNFKFLNFVLASINGNNGYLISDVDRDITKILSILKINLYRYSL